MTAETRCPVCKGPAERTKVSYQIGSLGDKPIMRQKKPWRTTAPDPATVAAMRELLGEIGEYSNILTVPSPDWGRWQARIATLLGPA